MKIEKTFTDESTEYKVSGSLWGGILDIIGGLLTVSVLLAVYLFIFVFILIASLIIIVIGVCAIPFAFVVGIGYGAYRLAYWLFGESDRARITRITKDTVKEYYK